MVDIFNISNPITGESIPLPVDETLKMDHLLVNFGFGFSPISDVYKLVVFRTYLHSKRRRGWKGLEVVVLTVGSGIWRRIGKVNVQVVDTEYEVFHDGFLHWICSSNTGSHFIRAFDVETERFRDIPMPPYYFDNHHRLPKFRIGLLQGSLSFTCSSNHTLSVWLMKEHGIAKFWTKELEIGYFRDSNGQPYTSEDLKYLQVLKFVDEGQVLLLTDRGSFYSYTPSTMNLLRVELFDRRPLQYMLFLVPNFASPKDILRNYISKHPEEEVETSSTTIVSTMKIPAWTTSVAGWGENEESELLEIPRGQPTPCLPLPENLKYVSSTTATSLLDMISGLNALLSLKCMAGKDEIRKLRKENEDLRAKSKLLLEEKLAVIPSL